MPEPQDQPRRILIVRPSALGDVARTVPCLVTLRQSFPKARIEWVVNAPFVDAIRHHPALGGGGDNADVPAVIPFARSESSALWRLMRELRQRRYDLVVDLQGLARSGLMTKATGAVLRVGDGRAREMAWLAYNRRPRIDADQHTVDRMLALLDAADLARAGISRDLTLYVSAEDQAWAAKFFAAEGLRERGSMAIAPTAQWGCKCWPAERFVELVKKLQAADSQTPRFLVLATPHEMSRVQPLLDALGKDAVWARTTVGQMMALLQRSRLLVCNDSAPLHLAVGLGVRTVSLFGPTDPALVGPYPRDDPRHIVLRAPSARGRTFQYRHQREDNQLISEITVQAVVDACRLMLEEG